jgi:ketosteroid isomerase-like protein
MLDELVHRAFQAFNQRDLAALLEIVHPEVRLHSLMTEAEGGDFTGHDGVRDWQRAILEIFPDWCPQLREVNDRGDAAIVRFHITATAAGSGARIDQGYWMAVHSRDGLVDFFGFYRSQPDASEALASHG